MGIPARCRSWGMAGPCTGGNILEGYLETGAVTPVPEAAPHVGGQGWDSISLLMVPEKAYRCGEEAGWFLR